MRCWTYDLDSRPAALGILQHAMHIHSASRGIIHTHHSIHAAASLPAAGRQLTILAAAMTLQAPLLCLQRCLMLDTRHAQQR